MIEIFLFLIIFNHYLFQNCIIFYENINVIPFVIKKGRTVVRSHLTMVKNIYVNFYDDCSNMIIT